MHLVEDDNIIDAEEMRELTVTPEVLYDRMFKAFLSNLVSSCGSAAAGRGEFSYTLPITETAFGTNTKKVLDQTNEVLTAKGYKVTIEENDQTGQEKQSPYKYSITVSWKDANEERSY